MICFGDGRRALHELHIAQQRYDVTRAALLHGAVQMGEGADVNHGCNIVEKRRRKSVRRGTTV
jgi:hypothetical protein